MASSAEDQDKPLEQEASASDVGVDLPSNNENVNTPVEECSASSSSQVEKPALQSPSPTKDKNVVKDPSDSIYQIKWISQNGVKSPIVTQNENGPCPLIAITNVLIMKGRISVPNLVDFVTTENLMAYLGDCILESIPKNIPEGTQLNFEQNMHDAMAVLPKLQTGLDVNVKFTGISDFEYTPECIIFDLLRIPLYHGWLIDPQMADVVSAIGKCSYNQLVEKIINSKCSPSTDSLTEALIAENFLEKTASQLTYHGLCELTSKLKEEELCVLFRNNHFSSIIKHKNCLYQLVTDQGFVNENVVWETLNNIDGDGQFVDSDFILIPPKSSDIPLPPNVSKENQIDQDFMVALSLLEEQQMQEKREFEWEDYKKKNLGCTNRLTDEELARRLQEKEMAEGNHSRVSNQQTSPNLTNSRSRPRDVGRSYGDEESPEEGDGSDGDVDGDGGVEELADLRHHFQEGGEEHGPEARADHL